jgi:hypothetical protein
LTTDVPNQNPHTRFSVPALGLFFLILLPPILPIVAGSFNHSSFLYDYITPLEDERPGGAPTMSTTIETFNPAALSRSDSLPTSLQANKTVAASSSKSSKNSNGATPQRIDFEPLYTDLKALIGHHWSTYQDALSKFVQGWSLKLNWYISIVF